MVSEVVALGIHNLHRHFSAVLDLIYIPADTQHSSNQNSQSLSQSTEFLQCNIAVNLQNVQGLSVSNPKEHMALLASVVESYDGLITSPIGNGNMTEEDYDQIDTE
ncbi:hypothetical protein Hanom_Chr03g00221021 [Helianthus anomalus]